jgi:hypothetical protein
VTVDLKRERSNLDHSSLWKTKGYSSYTLKMHKRSLREKRGCTSQGNLEWKLKRHSFQERLRARVERVRRRSGREWDALSKRERGQASQSKNISL